MCNLAIPPLSLRLSAIRDDTHRVSGPVVAALPASKEPAMYLFLTMSVAMLHLLALNLLYPKFVGARVHLNPLVVTVALMFWRPSRR